MGSINWVSFAFGIALVCMGFLCFFNSKVQQWGMKYTTQGVVWGKIVGEKRAPYVVKYVSFIGFLVFAGFVFYDAIYGH
jgi:peptidoglycan/LPS O-acetylase OafA/YrhL